MQFLLFLRLLERPQPMQVVEKTVRFSSSQFSRNEHFIQSHFSFVTQQYSSRCLQQSLSHIYQNCASSDCEPFSWNYSSNVWLLVSSSGWVASYWDSPWRLLLTLDGPAFGKCGWRFYLRNAAGCWGVDGCSSEGVQFDTFFNTQQGWIKYNIVGRRQFCSLSLTCQWKSFVR
jgi:hypothetical protein